jgi:hypothetical protein
MQDEWMEVSDIVERIVRATDDDAEFVRDEIVKLLRSGQIAGRSADTRQIIPASDWDGVSLSRSGAAVVPVLATVGRHQIELQLQDVLRCWMKWASFILTPLPDVLGRWPGCAPAEPVIKSGYPGKPTSRHLVEDQFHRRWNAGERHGSMSAWARELEGWLKKAHPGSPNATARTIRNQLSSSLPGNIKADL